MTAGFFALGGVALGALLNWLVSVSARRDARAERRRTERLDLITKFLADADTVWLAKQRLAHAVIEIQSDKQSEHGWSERRQAFEELRPALRDAKLAIGHMRLVWPEVVEPAAALLTSSEVYDAENAYEERAAREGAMQRLEAIAREAVEH